MNVGRTTLLLSFVDNHRLASNVTESWSSLKNLSVRSGPIPWSLFERISPVRLPFSFSGPGLCSNVSVRPGLHRHLTHGRRSAPASGKDRSRSCAKTGRILKERWNTAATVTRLFITRRNRFSHQMYAWRVRMFRHKEPKPPPRCVRVPDIHAYL